MAREYELVLYGATGYTGKYCAEHLQTSSPTDLKWAIAGRNESKLQSLAAELEKENPDRRQPGIEAINHDSADLNRLASQTTVLISCVGPFWKFGTPVIEACAKNGTHYLDITGEVPWVYDMISKFHDMAREKQTVLIPQSGIDSVPSDLMAYILVKYVRQHYNEGVLEIINSVQKIKNTASGGTAATALSLADGYSSSHLLKTMKPFALSPVPPSAAQNTAPSGLSSFLSKLRGYISVPELGFLTEWPFSALDRAIVHRSWGLFDNGNLYGKNFKFAYLLRARTAFQATLQAYILLALSILSVVKPARWLMTKFVPLPGEGAEKEEAKGFYMKYKAVAVTETGKRVLGSMDMQGGAYYWTGVFAAEGALELLRGSGGKAKKEGGVLTPATLEQGYIERLDKLGLQYHVKTLP